MFKFVRKEHYKKDAHRGKIVITYSVSEIVIGSLLLVATFLHIYIYLSGSYGSTKTQQLRIPMLNSLESGKQPAAKPAK